jgi:hypothetical protein
MAENANWLGDWVDSLPTKGWFKFLSTHFVVPYWAWREPKPKLPGGPRDAVQPGETLQRMMNLVMPLKDKTAVGRAQITIALGQNLDALYAGLDNVGTIHFARFVIIDNNLCMLSAYDGDFSSYVRDFIVSIGNVFDAVLVHCEGGDAVVPTKHNVEAFVDWVHAHDLFQMPDLATDLFTLQDEAMGLPAERPPHKLASLSRALVLQLDVNKNFSLGTGFRSYAGISAAQIRKQFGAGW